MARLCTFSDSAITDKSLSTSWNLCLQCLSRYTEISMIARKSLRLLRESVTRMLPEDDVHSTELESNGVASDSIDSDQKPDPRRGRKQILTNEGLPQAQITRTLEKLAQTGANSHEDLSGQTCDIPPPPSQVRQGMDCTLEDAISWDGLAGGLWASDPAEASYWFLNPYFSQLDTLQLNVDGMNVVS